MLITIATIVRLSIFFLMEIFCVNSLIWFYDWSVLEKCIQMILMVLYIVVSLGLLILRRIKNTQSGKHMKIVAIVEGTVSSLILYLILISAKFSGASVWLVLFLEVYISSMSAYTFYRGKSIDQQ